MMTQKRKNTRLLRMVLLLAVPCITTLLLLIGMAALHTPGFSPLSFAHAMTVQTTCASTQGTQATLCNQQNPIVQGCVQDAQSIEMVSVFTAQNRLIGEVDLRHSNRCKAYWVCTIAYANAQVQAIDATISFNDGTVQDHRKNIVHPDQRLVACTDLLQPTMVPKMTGVFHFRGQTPPMIIPL